MSKTKTKLKMKYPEEVADGVLTDNFSRSNLVRPVEQEIDNVLHTNGFAGLPASKMINPIVETPKGNYEEISRKSIEGDPRAKPAQKVMTNEEITDYISSLDKSIGEMQIDNIKLIDVNKIIKEADLSKREMDKITTPDGDPTSLVQDKIAADNNPTPHKGLRYNAGKLRYDLIPPFAMEQYARVMTKGAQKYAERNWERGMLWSNVIASLKRHLAEVEKGNDYDEETGILHAAHVMWNAAALTEYYKTYPQGDDRPHLYLRYPKIGLDIDEVLCDWVGAWTTFHNLPVPKTWFFHRDIMNRFKAMREDNTLNEFYMNLKPKISPEDIPFEPHCYVTSRPVPTEVTEKWLDKHCFPTVPVYTVEAGESKLEIIKKAGIEVFVDDRFENFAELNKAGICTFLLDAPHNQRYNVGYKRIKTLKELFDRI